MRPDHRRTFKRNKMPDKKFIRLPEVMALTGCKRTFIYQKIQDGDFPKQVKIGVSGCAWVLDEIESWMDARIAERDAKI